MPLPDEVLSAVVELDKPRSLGVSQILRDSGHPDGAYLDDIGDAAVHNRPLIRAAEPLYFSSPAAPDKPRINGRAIQQMCADGRWKPTRNRVLLEALWETEANDSEIARNAKAAGIGHKAREAIAFIVKAIGPGVPDCGFAVGDIVTHNSAAGDPVDHTDESCPYWTVHFEDITGTAG